MFGASFRLSLAGTWKCILDQNVGTENWKAPVGISVSEKIPAYLRTSNWTADRSSQPVYFLLAMPDIILKSGIADRRARKIQSHTAAAARDSTIYWHPHKHGLISSRAPSDTTS